MRSEEVVVTIRASESELDCIVWALTAIKTIRIPVDPKWKAPFKAILKDMIRIQDNLEEAKRDSVNDQQEKSRFDIGIDVEKEIQKSQGTLVAGCKGDDCD